VKFAFIEAEEANFPIYFMCKQLEVSRSGYYAWRGRGPSSRVAADVEFAKVVIRIYGDGRGIYGTPRFRGVLARSGLRVGRRRIGRLMRTRGLQVRCRRRFRRTTDSRHSLPIAPNHLDRKFDVTRPNEVWVGDITYIWTSEGWLYLAVLIDLFSRKVVGWSMSESLDRQVCVAALDAALKARRPQKCLMHHSDRGSQYASREYTGRLREASIVASMSRVGDCWDNAVAESFFSTLKTELVN